MAKTGKWSKIGKLMKISKLFKTELPRILGFCLVGGGGFIVHATLVVLQTSFWNMPPIFAWFPAFLMAVIFTWLMNRFLTFRGLGTHSTTGEAVRYFIIQSIGATINFTVYASLVAKGPGFLSRPFFALVGGAASALFFNYLALRFLVFKKASASKIATDPKTPNGNIDDIYYEHAMSIPLARRVLIFARKSMYQHFIKTMRPNSESLILDFGVSETENDQANMLEKLWPYPQNITCAGMGDGRELKQANPKVNYIRIKAGEKMDFPDNHFDIAYSNAVFEHVGSKQAREEILSELKRVAKSVYITTPNRWFFVEHHTAVPFLHYWPKLFRSFMRDSKYEFWALPQNLQFISLNDLKKVFTSAGLKPKSGYCGLWIGPFSSNIVCWAHGSDKDEK